MAKKTPIPDTNFFILNDRYVLLDEFLPGLQDRTVELDLGCGKGDFAVALASRFPDRVVLAADVMLGRLRKVVRKSMAGSEDGGLLDNLYFLRVEARHLLSIVLPDSCLDRLHILCPDPWPKFKHKGHRLLSSDFMAQICRVLKPGGIFHFSTDDVPYLNAASKNVETSGLFETADPAALSDVSDIRTEFEMQWLALGKSVTHRVWRSRKGEKES